MPLRPWRDHLPLATVADVDVLTAEGSLPAAWSRRWATHPAAPLLYQVAGQGPDARRWVRAAELEERTRAAAAVLHRMGLRAGDALLWSSGPAVDGIVANVAALRAGLVVVPVNPAAAARELAHVAVDVSAAAAVVAAPAQGALLAAAGVPLVLDSRLQVLHGAASGDPVPDAARPGDAALVGYTSGTTGAPKGAVLSHANVLANSTALALAWRWGPEDRLVHALPLFHGHGLCAALYTSLLVGASAVLLPGFGVDEVIDAAGEHRATLFFGVPTMYHRLAASPRARELGGLRLAVSGSAPLAADLHRRMGAAGVDVLERYGMTETLLTVSNPVDGERRAGTVGFPLPGVEAELRAGELLVRGPQVFSGYRGRPASDEAAFVDGWFRTGDLAEEEDGYLRILGRSGEVVISGGHNVYPAEVEDVLLRHPSVAEVAVTGTPSDEWGEVVTAWVVPADGAGLSRGAGTDGDGGSRRRAALLEFAAGELSAYKRPRLVHFVAELPRNAMGKVQRGELR